ncbi:MAG: AEC family transporter [Rhizobiales bacterium]|nr:AEC family transporter [Hyphomicrobiales bacterium]
MHQVITIVAPVFAFMALGWLAARTRFLDASVEKGLSAFALWVAIPALLFRLTSQAELPDVAPWGYWLAFLVAGAACWISAVLLAHILGRPRSTGPAFAMGAAYGNTVMLGIPLCLNMFGDDAAIPIALLTAVHAPVLWLASTVQYEWTTASQGKSLLKVSRELAVVLAKNPVILAILAGTTWGQLGIGMHPVVSDIITQLGQAAIPAALFALGMSFVAYSIRRELRAAPALTLLKMVLMPAIVWVMVAHVFALPPVWAGTAVIMAATPTGINAYLFAAKYDVGVASVSSTIVLSTAASVVVIPAIILMLA